MIRPAASIGFATLTLSLLFGQQAGAPLSFEVASIKPSGSDDHRSMIQIQPGGGFRAVGATLKMLVTLAYDVRDFQISGGPGWISSERYDIMAKSEPSPDSSNVPDDPRKMNDEQRKTLQEQMRERLRSLLAERFQLKIHRESKEQAVYALVIGKGGSKLQESEVKEGGGPRGMMRMGRGQLIGTAVQMQMLVSSLSSQLGRPVIDRTGLKGNYDFKLEWTPDPGQAGGGPLGAVPPGADAPPPPDPNGPSIFTAVQEQLGLRLESQKGPVETLIIDHVEKPSEN